MNDGGKRGEVFCRLLRMRQKHIFLFLALLLPVCIFLFLKIFGRNEFYIPPLYADVYPETAGECENKVSLPYIIPDSVRSRFNVQKDSLSLIYFGELRDNSAVQLKRVKSDFGNAVKLYIVSPLGASWELKKCIFYLKEPFDIVLLDSRGTIRGQYIAADREEIDRLLTELTILFKKY